MSTMDSLINTAAMTISMDIAPQNLDDKKRLQISRISTLIVSLIAIIAAISIRSILKLSFVASDIITSGVFVPLILGFLWKRGTFIGAVASMVFGVIFAFYNLAVIEELTCLYFGKQVQHLNLLSV